jgi:hypothetical protein
MRQYMKKEPSYELIGFDSHGLFFITICIVPPAERNIAVLDFQDAIVTDSDPVGISAQILKDTLSSVKRRLAIDNPFFMVEPASEHFKNMGVFQMTNATGEDKITRLETAFEIIQELTPEQRGHNPYRDEKPFPA